MDLTIIFSILISFAVTAVSGYFVLRVMRKLKAAQTEREDGVQSHLKKAGTPTMGGIMIIIGIIITSLIYVGRYPKIIPVLILTAGFCVIGFLDDFLKVVLRRSDGLMPWQKLLGQFVVTVLFYISLRHAGISMAMIIPFTGGEAVDIGIIAVPFLFIVVLATVNGVNFTDGVDGLAASVTVVVSMAFIIISMVIKGEVEPAAGAVIGALLAFLLYNANPAKIFMGDTGSLALGGFVAGTAYVLQMPLYIPVIGFIYTIELLSVVLQVSYFKKTHGKRLFKMAPIHHHFEISGWSETRVVTIFTIITMLTCLLAMINLV